MEKDEYQKDLMRGQRGTFPVYALGYANSTAIIVLEWLWGSLSPRSLYKANFSLMAKANRVEITFVSELAQGLDTPLLFVCNACRHFLSLYQNKKPNTLRNNFKVFQWPTFKIRLQKICAKLEKSAKLPVA